MTIRDITDKDTEQVNNLYKQLYANFQGSVDLTAKSFDSKSITVVGEDENHQLAGFILAIYLKFGEGKHSEAHIMDLVVDEEKCGQGIGTSLMKGLENRLQELGVDHIFVSVDPDGDEINPTPFYQKLGYIVMKYPWLVKKLKPFRFPN